MTATAAVFVVVVLAELLLLVSLLVSIARPARRVWPPPSRASWRFWWTWGLTAVAFLGSFVLAWLDYGSFLLDPLAWKAAGVVLVALGAGLADWGVRTLGRRTSQGLGGPFTVAGPYRWSRNPQYIGHALVVAGVTLIADSTLLLLTAPLAITCLLVTPLAEEPWLEDRYGEAYRAYRRRVPRFLGRRRDRPPLA